mmetsp:Transcript_7931/g.23397  ORF Transcript_7931/g.23397 Transcript_7931/m.23397 type:complete len:218 (-) Transcript_7931:357-1010(-)
MRRSCPWSEGACSLSAAASCQATRSRASASATPCSHSARCCCWGCFAPPAPSVGGNAPRGSTSWCTAAAASVAGSCRQKNTSSSSPITPAASSARAAAGLGADPAAASAPHSARVSREPCRAAAMAAITVARLGPASPLPGRSSEVRRTAMRRPAGDTAPPASRSSTLTGRSDSRGARGATGSPMLASLERRATPARGVVPVLLPELWMPCTRGAAA